MANDISKFTLRTDGYSTARIFLPRQGEAGTLKFTFSAGFCNLINKSLTAYTTPAFIIF